MNLKCMFSGHLWRQTADGAKRPVIYQKGERQEVTYYSGKVFRCLRCGEERYIGSRTPYARMVDGATSKSS